MKKNVQTDPYEIATHRTGRAWSALAIIIMMGVPAAICLYFGVYPPLKGFLMGLVGVVSIYLPVAIIEVLTYSPMVGSAGAYLMFVTGNLANMKVPCAVNAMDVAGVKPGSREGEIVATIAVATSSIVTDLIIVLGVVGLSFLHPVLENPVLAPAFNNVLPALFGALGIVWLRKYWKVAIIPSIIMIVVFIFLPVSLLGIMVAVAAVLSVISARILYKRGMI